MPYKPAHFVDTDISWLIGGPQGSGVESAANIFSHVCSAAGYQVFGKREFYSNIKGEHSYFLVRVADGTIRSNVNDVNLITSYDAETIFRHAEEVPAGGAILYDTELGKITTDAVATLDGPFRKRLDGHLADKGKPATVDGMLETVSDAGVKLIPVSFSSILQELAEKEDNPKLRNMKRMFNVIGVSLSLGVLGMSPEPLYGSVMSIFAKKPKVAELNRKVARMAHEMGAGLDCGCKLGNTSKKPHTMLVQGYQGTALGKIACGCRFQPYYPITPASDESVYLETNETFEVAGDRPGSLLVVQTEDEISAMGMAIGGSLTGTRSATCTSGPGFSLMAEMLGWSGINEVPLVVTNYQRSGPSTGLPTRHGQDDLLFAIHAGHGEFPRVVYSSGDVEESFYDTAMCFNLADIYQLPVIHMMDKAMASSVTTCPRFEPDRMTINRGKLLESMEPGDYRRFALVPDGISPRSKIGLENGIFWNTGDESDEYGHITEDPVVRVQMMDKRHSKLGRILREVPDEDQAISYGVHEYTVIGWGSSKGPVLDAISMLEQEGKKVGFVQVKMLQPFPADYLRFLLGDARVIIDVESNQTGQLGGLLRQHLGREPDHYILKYTGRAMTSTEVHGALKDILRGGAKKREVLMHGA
ncbi:2-oxoglutarate ferredoxin oxidoreductase, alpha subunit [Cenarchaeum symbiosum A]|uniref:2-oxoglutarate ferredoxin oxidoreductase, alpha subunit n=1 Tax=Cenarchaeum symbiosum (strain A) TaxID=414004 RepID=A0RUD1_CENSY|nr:2-oxoglutarate ferredoxin oxidoreductase, alpha subunit [Cenarchaeum symbiosum A]